MKFLLPFLFLFVLAATGNGSDAPGAEPEWQSVVALDAGPQGRAASADEARTIALDFLNKQETALRAYLTKCPTGSHGVDAQLRLARLLATRSSLTGSAAPFEAGLRVLEEGAKSAPESRAADFAFARVALIMRRVAIPTDDDRTIISNEMISFQKRFPGDRRIAALITEVASLYDDQPNYKKLLLNQALAAGPSGELRPRIKDDLKRLDLLGLPIPLQGTATDGTQVDIALFRGKIVLIYFFATWSAPSVAGLAEVNYLRKAFPESQLAAVGVDLDQKREALESISKSCGIAWPVLCDGRGWQSPLVRGLSINALPTLWILDKQGRLRTLNATKESETLVRRLLEEN